MYYCPRCGTGLVSKFDGGRERPACPIEACGFIHFGYSSIGCGAVVMRDGKALLIQRGINPRRGDWQLPGGYVEADEEIVDAVEREVLEEAGIIARVTDVVGLRHSVAGSIGGPSANVYVVFRLEVVSGEPRYDGEETIGAGYFQPPGDRAYGRGAVPLHLGDPTSPGDSAHRRVYFVSGGRCFIRSSWLVPVWDRRIADTTERI